jgi:hypothetical protein
MVEIKKLGPRCRPDYNWAVFKNGKHVDALVTLVDSPDTWRLWRGDVDYTEEERRVIDAKLTELNSKAR